MIGELKVALLVYEAMGQDKEARNEFQKVYAEAPSYEDIAAKLGL